MIVGYLVRSPPLTPSVKLILLFGLFVLPTSASFVGNAANLETTKSLSFCGSCHVMAFYVDDVRDPDSQSLAAAHARLEVFRDEACYACHSDYGMFSGVTTKIGGMRHVLEFYTDDWSEPGHPPPALYEPYDGRKCQACHHLKHPGAPLEHRVHEEKIASREISCVAAGCHGPPHPPWRQVAEPR